MLLIAAISIVLVACWSLAEARCSLYDRGRNACRTSYNACRRLRPMAVLCLVSFASGQDPCARTCDGQTCGSLNASYSCDYLNSSMGCDCIGCCLASVGPLNPVAMSPPSPPLPSPPLCRSSDVDEDLVGSDGTGCSWYDSYPVDCGKYDDDDFVAAALCCGCGGGLTQNPPPWAPPVITQLPSPPPPGLPPQPPSVPPAPPATPPPMPPVCTPSDDEGRAKDRYSDGCKAYKANPNPDPEP